MTRDLFAQFETSFAIGENWIELEGFDTYFWVALD